MAFWLICYDLIIFGVFYTLYEISIAFGLLFSSTIYYIVTISVVLLINISSISLMIFILKHLYASLKLVESLNQRAILKERKRVAWVIVFQGIVNFFLVFLRIAAFYNVSLRFSNQPTIECYGLAGAIYNAFGYTFQEFFVCIDCIINLFVLTSYREQLFRFLKIVSNRYKVHVLMVSVMPSSGNTGIIQHRI